MTKVEIGCPSCGLPYVEYEMRTAVIIDANDGTIYLLPIPDSVEDIDLEEYILERHDLSDCNYMVVDKVKIVKL